MLVFQICAIINLILASLSYWLGNAAGVAYSMGITIICFLCMFAEAGNEK